MILDFTAELAPLLWGVIGLLLISAGAVLACIDPEIAELYVGDRRLVLVTAAMAVVTLGALIAAVPAIATGLGLPLR
jgi:hypothetical protein